jgi:hypothetical protein
LAAGQGIARTLLRKNMHQSQQKNPARARDRWVELEDEGSGKRGWRSAATKTRRSPLRDQNARAAKEDRRWGVERPR